MPPTDSSNAINLASRKKLNLETNSIFLFRLLLQITRNPKDFCYPSQHANFNIQTA